MREIKFRIIYQNKIFAYERLTENGWQWMVLELNPDKGERWNSGVLKDSHKLIRNQFTGLKDKNGIDIYENDLIQIANNVIYEIVWVDLNEDAELYSTFALKNEEKGLLFHIDAYAYPNMIKVGNSFENKELLTK